MRLIASILGLAYSVLQVRYFGASRTIEIYFAAQSLVYLVTSLTQSGQLAEIFLPVYHQLNHKSKGLGFLALNVVINRMLLYGSMLLMLMFFLAPHIISLLIPGFSASDKEFATLIFRALIPCIYLQFVKSFFVTVLNAEKKFGRSELLGLTNGIVSIVILLVLYPYVKIWALVISLLLGSIIEFIFYILQLYKIGFKYKFILSHVKFNHNIFFKSMHSTLLYVGSTQIYNIVLTSSISYLPEGTFAIYKYVQNFSTKIRSLFIQPFMTLFFTEYSLFVRKSKSVVVIFYNYISGIICMNSVIIIGSILLGEFIIYFIWGGKKFTLEDVHLAYVFLLFNALAMLLASIGGVYRKMAVTQGKARSLYSVWVVAQLLSALFGYLIIATYKVTGLYFIVPVNSFLLGLTSYVVYKTTHNAMVYNFITVNNIIIVCLIMLAASIKVFGFELLNADLIFDYVNDKYSMIFYFIFTIILSSYPMFIIYKVFTKQTNYV